MTLLDPRTIRELAAQLGLRPSKQRGQNFVHDANTVRRIVATAALSPEDVVLEIGPGLGSLTLGLLETGVRVVAVEIEQSLATQLPQTVAEYLPAAKPQLHVIAGDALQLRQSATGGVEIPTGENSPWVPTAVVANLPYNVSVPVILHLLEHFESIRRGLVMVQAEVADRLVAVPGSKVYGIPSAKLAWYATAARVGSVPPSVFWPIPNVESGLVAFTRHSAATTPSPAQVFRVIDAAFAQRRKMLRGTLSGLFGSSQAAAAALTAAGIDPTLRGERLSIADFARIATLLPPSSK